jgi:hypothetical protein
MKIKSKSQPRLITPDAEPLRQDFLILPKILDRISKKVRNKRRGNEF